MTTPLDTAPITGSLTTMLRFFRVCRGLAVTVGAGLLALSACTQDLHVTDPVNLTPGDLGTAAPISLTINGALGAFQSAYPREAMLTGVLTDELVNAGTDPARSEIDSRTFPNNNENLLNFSYIPLSTARFMADTALVILEAAKGGVGVSEAERLPAVALVRYLGGYTRALFAEGYCASAIGGGAALSSDDRMKDALTVFQDAETKAVAAGDTTLVAAAKLGEARAQLWLGNYAAAGTAAAAVPAAGFVLNALYSNASTSQYNPIVVGTYGTSDAIRWGIGDGTTASLGFEKNMYLNDFLAIGLLKRRPDLQSFAPGVPVIAQTLYTDVASPIAMATSVEAQLIQAEVKLRASDLTGAAALVNVVRAAKYHLPAITFTGTLGVDLRVIAEERARELFITGDRVATSRRFLKDGIDLFPVRLGTATCFPVPLREINTNPNAH